MEGPNNIDAPCWVKLTAKHPLSTDQAHLYGSSWLLPRYTPSALHLVAGSRVSMRPGLSVQHDSAHTRTYLYGSNMNSQMDMPRCA